MSPVHWSRVKEILASALDLPEDQRSAFLDAQCGSDSGLRSEVEKLLAAESGPLENPLLNAFAKLAQTELARGEMLGPYRVETMIGHGGMGVVYRAWDTRLDRRIALKVLRPEQVNDPARRQRLFREARAASSLIHPNIVTVHDIGSDRDIDFIAMEYIDGRCLDELIPSSGLPVKQALAYAIQISGALAGAHAAGIVHRDLKPGNIMITREGLVKLLDFGLARKTHLTEGAGHTLTIEGQIAGTPSYMSPEQVRGEPIDHRSDIFSMGAVFYRMLTGRDAFQGGSAVETMNAILTAEPADLSKDGRDVPFALESVIQHCLEKAPEDRFQSAKDVGYALEASAGAPVLDVAPSRQRHTYLGWAAAILAATGLGAMLGYSIFAARHAPASIDGKTFAQLTDESGAELFPSLSGDGKTLVYAGKASGNWDIYARRIGAGEPVNLTRNFAGDDMQPALSPDAGQIAFRSEHEGGGIFVMRADGTGVRHIADSGYNPVWSPDGKEILFAEEGITRPEDRSGNLSRLWAVELATGRKRQVTQDDAVQPQWSPTGRHIAYWAIDLDGDRDLWTVPADGGRPTRVTRDRYLDWNPVWSPDGAWLYFCSNRGGSMGIWRMPMKENSGEARGAPEPIRTPAAYPAHLTFSRDGRHLAYAQILTTGRLATVRFDPERNALLSEPKTILQSPKGASRPALSPDGKWLAFNSTEQDEELFLLGADGTGLRQLTSGGHRNRGPRWSPDGKQLAFFSTRSADWEIWTTDASGAEPRQVTYLAGQNVAWPVWSAEGKHLAYTLFGFSTYLIDLAKPWAAQAPEKLPAFPEPGKLFNGWWWSPDGRTLAGFLNRDDGIALYNVATRTYRRLTDHGSDPVWLHDNRRLFFHHNGRIHIVDSESGSSRELLSILPEEIARRGFAVSPDDRHIYYSVSSTEADVWVVEFAR